MKIICRSRIIQVLISSKRNVALEEIIPNTPRSEVWGGYMLHNKSFLYQSTLSYNKLSNQNV